MTCGPNTERAESAQAKADGMRLEASTRKDEVESIKKDMAELDDKIRKL